MPPSNISKILAQGCYETHYKSINPCPPIENSSQFYLFLERVGENRKAVSSCYLEEDPLYIKRLKGQLTEATQCIGRSRFFLDFGRMGWPVRGVDELSNAQKEMLSEVRSKTLGWQNEERVDLKREIRFVFSEDVMIASLLIGAIGGTILGGKIGWALRHKSFFRDVTVVIGGLLGGSMGMCVGPLIVGYVEGKQRDKIREKVKNNNREFQMSVLLGNS